jgi:hypothetical protein
VTPSGYRGEVRPRRRPTRHNIHVSAATHSTAPVSDPYEPISAGGFPAFYQRNPIRNQYRKYMRLKSIYQQRHWS